MVCDCLNGMIHARLTGLAAVSIPFFSGQQTSWPIQKEGEWERFHLLSHWHKSQKVQKCTKISFTVLINMEGTQLMLFAKSM